MPERICCFHTDTEEPLGNFVVDVVPRIGEKVSLNKDGKFTEFLVHQVCHGFYRQQEADARSKGDPTVHHVSFINVDLLLKPLVQEKKPVVLPVEVMDFKDFVVNRFYALGGPQWPGLPQPSYNIDGLPLWSRDSVITYAAAVLRYSK